MSDCIEEQQTRHFRGRWYGFGPVQDYEELIFAVFEQTIRNGDRLDAACFKQLADCSQSVTRARFVTQGAFDRNVVHPGVKTKGQFVGMAVAHTSSLRRLRADITVKHRTKSVRSICIIDRVDKGDYDGHATMGYAEQIEALGQTLKGKKRMAIRLDLVNEFSNISACESR